MSAGTARDRARQVLAWLAIEFPTNYPVTLRLALPTQGAVADCTRSGRRFVIRIRPGLLWPVTLDCLLHEYAHALAWPAGRARSFHPEHSDEWGLWYARIYRRFVDEGGDDASREIGPHRKQVSCGRSMRLRKASAIAALPLAGCLHWGDAFEAACIKGRLSPAQATAINAQTWERRPGYCRGETYTDDSGVVREGGAHCEVEPGDRVLAAHCSVAGVVLGAGD